MLLVVFWSTAMMLVYVHVFYPAAMCAVDWCCGRDISRSDELDVTPTVSLIIPAHNEDQVLRSTILSALQIEYPAELLEIIVANDGSEDRTAEIAKEFVARGVKVLDFHTRRGKASVINDSVGASRGEILCFADANVEFEPNSLKTMLGRFKDRQVGAASADVRILNDGSQLSAGERLYYRIERAVQHGESCVGSMMGVDGGMYTMRREYFQPLNPDTILDDFVNSMQVIQHGKRIVYEPRAIARERGTPHAAVEFRRRVRVSAGAMQSMKRAKVPPYFRPIELWQYVSHKFLRWMSPLLLLSLLSTNMLLWNQGNIYRGLMIAQVCVYGMALAAAIIPRLRYTTLFGVVFFVVMSQVATLVGLAKGLFNLQPVAWHRSERCEQIAS